MSKKTGSDSEPAIPLAATTDVEAGSKIIVIGHPQGLEFTVSDGLVGSIRELSPGHKILQITAPISAGSSGGPILTMGGKAAGMTTAFLAEGQNLNFAVVAEDIKKVLDAVRSGKESLTEDEAGLDRPSVSAKFCGGTRTVLPEDQTLR